MTIRWGYKISKGDDYYINKHAIICQMIRLCDSEPNVRFQVSPTQMFDLQY